MGACPGTGREPLSRRTYGLGVSFRSILRMVYCKTCRTWWKAGESVAAGTRTSAQQGAKGRRRRRAFIAGAAIAILIFALVGGAIWQQRFAPFRTTVLIVDDSSIAMGYFLKRILMLRQEPLSVLRTLAFEEIVKQVAPTAPYHIQVSDAEVERHLRDMAGGSKGLISDAEFAEWYRQQLNESRLSDAEFRDLAHTRLLSLRLQAYLEERIPTVAEQVHLHAIVQETVEHARSVKAKLDAGEAFSPLARALSTDATLRASGGDLGWYPRTALAPELAALAFDQLQIGEYSDLVQFGDQRVAIFMVSERAAAREVDADALAAMREDVLENWFNAEFGRHKVQYHGFDNGYDSETDTWIRRQLKAMEQPAGQPR
jgi:PPIC-type PPIASE domain